MRTTVDINVLVIALTFSLCLQLFAFLGKRAGWKFLGLFAVTIALLTALVLQNDGSLTEIEAGQIQTIAAANGNFISDFNLIVVVPLCVAFGEAFMTIRLVFHI